MLNTPFLCRPCSVGNYVPIYVSRRTTNEKMRANLRVRSYTGVDLGFAERCHGKLGSRWESLGVLGTPVLVQSNPEALDGARRSFIYFHHAEYSKTEAESHCSNISTHLWDPLCKMPKSDVESYCDQGIWKNHGFTVSFTPYGHFGHFGRGFLSWDIEGSYNCRVVSKHGDPWLEFRTINSLTWPLQFRDLRVMSRPMPIAMLGVNKE